MTVPASAMVLAAGFGTRMGALTKDQPKPLLQVSGKPLIDHTLDLLAGAGVARAVINLHYLGGKIRAHLSTRTAPRILYSDEQPDILDTGGGVVQALPMLGEKPFITLNSDAVFCGPNPVEVLADGWDRNRVDALLLLVPTGRAHAYSRAGDFFLDDGPMSPRRRGPAPSAPYVFSGAQMVRPDAYRDTPDGPFSNNLIWSRLLSSGRLGAVVYPGQWVDVGTPEGLNAAEDLLGHT